MSIAVATSAIDVLTQSAVHDEAGKDSGWIFSFPIDLWIARAIQWRRVSGIIPLSFFSSFDLFEIVSRSSGGGCKGAIVPYSMFIAII